MTHVHIKLFSALFKTTFLVIVQLMFGKPRYKSEFKSYYKLTPIILDTVHHRKINIHFLQFYFPTKVLMILT